MITLLISSFALATQSTATLCPIMGHPAVASGGFSDYAGLRFAYCCSGCKDAFEKAPLATFEKSVKDKKTVALSLFDPVSRRRLDEKDAKGGFVDFESVRYFFATPDNKATFEKEPKKYAARPKQEVLYCIVMDHGLGGYAGAGSYVDHADVRYYFCCPNCSAEFEKAPATFVASAKSKVTTPKVANPKSG